MHDPRPRRHTFSRLKHLPGTKAWSMRSSEGSHPNSTSGSWGPTHQCAYAAAMAGAVVPPLQSLGEVAMWPWPAVVCPCEAGPKQRFACPKRPVLHRSITWPCAYVALCVRCAYMALGCRPRRERRTVRCVSKSMRKVGAHAPCVLEHAGAHAPCVLEHAGAHASCGAAANPRRTGAAQGPANGPR